MHKIKILSNEIPYCGLTDNNFFLVAHEIMVHLAINCVIDLVHTAVINSGWAYIQNEDIQYLLSSLYFRTLWEELRIQSRSIPSFLEDEAATHKGKRAIERPSQPSF